MKISVNIQETKSNLKYFFICEVRAKQVDGDVRTIYRCLDKESAEEYLQFARCTYERLYSSFWVSEEIIWL